MSNISFLQQYKLIVTHGIQAELAEKDRVISPLLFSATMLILFAFAVGETQGDMIIKIYLAQTFLTILFALQTSFSRIFDPDMRDKVFELLQSYPLSRPAWFLGKYTLVMILGIIIVLPTMFLAGIFNDHQNVNLINPMVYLISFLTLAGLSSLGVLLSAITLSSSGREVLFPLLYFPLATPILLAAIQSSLVFLGAADNEGQWQWVGLLCGFDVIYFTLGILLFSELLEA